MIKEKYHNDYQSYLYDQIVTFHSFEGEHEDWNTGLKKTIDKLFRDEDKKSSILDMACGDGTSIEYLRELGFVNIYGVEINNKKIERAKIKNSFNNIYACDIHEINTLFKDMKFDIVFSSHTLEHSLYPKIVLSHIKALMKDTSKFFLIVPYPCMEFEGHPCVNELCLNIEDEGKNYFNYLTDNGFKIKESEITNIREPEIITRLSL